MRRGILTNMMVVFTLVALVVAGCGQSEESGEQQAETVKLGITQIVEHPALDALRQGVLDALADNDYKKDENLTVDFEVAQGNFDTAVTIGQKFMGDDVDLVVAISTPSAQAAVQAASKTETPVVFAAVTDPKEAGLVKSMEQPGGYVTGTSDQVPMDKLVELIRDFVPDANKLGVIYNAGEVNSGVQVEQIEKAAQSLNIEVIRAGITTGSEVQQGTQSLIGKVDAILIPTDNTVVSAFEGVLSVAQDNQIPVFASDSDTVKRGAVATYGVDYYQMGYQTGENMVVPILKGEQAGNIAVEVSQKVDLVINTKAAENFGLAVSQEMKDKAKEIINE